MTAGKKSTLLVLALMLAGGAGAAYTLWPQELSAPFCYKLKDPEAYEKNQLEHYTFLIPGKDGWIFRTENDFRSEWAVNAKTTGYLQTLSDAFRRNNAELIVVMPPVRGMVHAAELSPKYQKRYGLDNPAELWSRYESSLQNLQKQGVHVVGINQEEATSGFFYKRNHHWTAEGAGITARKTAEEVKKLAVYQGIPKTGYATVKKQPVAYKSSFEKAFKKICETDIADEMADHYETTAQWTAQDEKNLFAEKPAPQVILLGTSNSVSETSEANFEGFLKEYLSADVMNLSQVGAGIDTSIMAYLNSPGFHDGQPKVVIWEVPGYYDLNVMDDKLFNQIIPAAFGGCSSAPLYQHNFDNISPGTTTLIDVQRDAALQGLQPAAFVSGTQNLNFGEDAYLHLSFSEPVKEKFSVSFTYEEAGNKKQDFARDQIYPHDGQFYTLFPQEEEPLQKISLTLPQTMEHVSFNLQLCPIPGTPPQPKTPESSAATQEGAAENIGQPL